MPGWESTLICCETEVGSISASAVTLQTQRKVWGQQWKQWRPQRKPCSYRGGRTSRGETEVSLISFWQGQQTLILLCQGKVALLARGEPLVTSAHVYALNTVWEHIKEQCCQLSPPLPYTNTALFSQLGSLFLFRFGRVNSFSYSSVLLVEDCVPSISCMQYLLVVSALETSRFVHLHHPRWRLQEAIPREDCKRQFLLSLCVLNSAWSAYSQFWFSYWMQTEYQMLTHR